MMRMGRAALSIRGRQGFRLLNFHLLFAARRLALTGFRTQNFCPTYGTTISLSEFAHASNPLSCILPNFKKLTSSIPSPRRSAGPFRLRPE
jgi:hypothetical protein